MRLWSTTRVDAPARGRRVYRERREALATLVDAAPAPSGINLWVPVPDEFTAVRALRDEGWAVAAGAPYRLSPGSAIRITTAALEPRTRRGWLRRSSAPSARRAGPGRLDGDDHRKVAGGPDHGCLEPASPSQASCSSARLGRS